MNTTTSARSLSFKMRAGITASVIAMAVAAPVQFFAATPASAVDQYDAKIQALRDKVSNYENEANALRKKADTLQNTLNQLSADKSKIQAELDLKQAEHGKLVGEIAVVEGQIKENRKITGDLIVQSSISDDVPLIVRLASSENLADYIDGEATRISIRDTMVQKTEQSETLKAQLKEKQEQVKAVLDEQKLKRDELATKEAAQQKLITETRNNEASYQEMIKSSESQIREFQKAQDELRRFRQQGVGGGTYVTSSGTGGYPWSGAAGYPYPCWSASCVDPWALYYRECTSYVAWRLANQGYGVRGFAGAGHAYQWPGTAAGYTSQSSTPKKGDAAVYDAYENGAAWTGHVMYVEQVYGDGSILISEYNWAGNGTYSERRLTPSEYSGTTFISFPRR